MRIRSVVCSFALLLAPLAAQEMPKPGPEHQKLAALAGTWEGTVETVGPDGKPMQFKGTAVLKLDFNGFWLIEDFTADFMGMPFHGHGQHGFDPARGKYVSSWIDSMSPSLTVIEGTMDKAGKVLTLSGKTTGMDGKPAEMRETLTLVDANTYTLEMHTVGGDGKDEVMKITYKRTAGAAAEKATDKPAGKAK